MRKIGILEDDRKLGSELKLFLETNGYEGWFIPPSEYARGDEEELISLLLNGKPDLLLLDVGLPGVDGLHLCRTIRERSKLPIIMITSDNSELTELVSITNGADDFLPKPFNTRILLARIGRIMERVYNDGGTGDRIEVETGSGQRFTVEFLKGRLLGPEGGIDLSKNELQILRVLTVRKGEVVSRGDMIDLLWDNQAFVDDNTLTVNMTRIKSKLEKVGIKDAIETRRGMGYMLL
ncbi:MAG: response regulator transcription factor [Lachnospiraceae bacterium]|nr:response regulator transcription factor [Lachnospiraceae bacterium]